MGADELDSWSTNYFGVYWVIALIFIAIFIGGDSTISLVISAVVAAIALFLQIFISMRKQNQTQSTVSHPSLNNSESDNSHTLESKVTNKAGNIQESNSTVFMCQSDDLVQKKAEESTTISQEHVVPTFSKDTPQHIDSSNNLDDHEGVSSSNGCINESKYTEKVKCVRTHIDKDNYKVTVLPYEGPNVSSCNVVVGSNDDKFYGWTKTMRAKERYLDTDYFGAKNTNDYYQWEDDKDAFEQVGYNSYFINFDHQPENETDNY